jgi:hypothetical protein
MAKKGNLEHLDEAMESANLKEASKQKKVSSKQKKVKTIQILVDWEDRIKNYYGGTVASYITQAIQEKMIKDGIL